MEVHGRIAGSSNATLLVTCRWQGEELLAVYKPLQGERPLWDFPGGLFRREVAAYVLSESLGWGLVPETVERPEGPFGPGSVQRFVHEDGTSRCATRPSGTPSSSAWAPSTSSPTTPTARAGTSSWPRSGCGPSTTASASTRRTSCAR